MGGSTSCSRARQPELRFPLHDILAVLRVGHQESGIRAWPFDIVSLPWRRDLSNRVAHPRNTGSCDHPLEGLDA